MNAGAAAAATCTSDSYLAACFAALPVVTVPGDYADINAALGAVLANGQGGGSIVLADTIPTTHALNDVYNITGVSLCIQGAGRDVTLVTSAGNGIRHLVANASGVVQVLGLQLDGGSDGGGIELWTSEAAFYSMDFQHNLAPAGDGGALFVVGSVVQEALDLRFVGNGATKSGGAIGLSTTSGASPVRSYFHGGHGLVFQGNAALEKGGAVSSLNSTFSARDGLVFDGNGAGKSGGAVYAGAGSNLTGEDGWSFLRNAAPRVGGGLHCESSTCTGGHRWLFHENWVWEEFVGWGSGGIGGAVEAFASTFTLGNNVTVSCNKGEWATGGKWFGQIGMEKTGTPFGVGLADCPDF